MVDKKLCTVRRNKVSVNRTYWDEGDGNFIQYQSVSKYTASRHCIFKC